MKYNKNKNDAYVEYKYFFHLQEVKYKAPTQLFELDKK
jgi:hypothetical protein